MYEHFVILFRYSEKLISESILRRCEKPLKVGIPPQFEKPIGVLIQRV